jgi:hypothetical protein
MHVCGLWARVCARLSVDVLSGAGSVMVVLLLLLRVLLQVAGPWLPTCLAFWHMHDLLFMGLLMGVASSTRMRTACIGAVEYSAAAVACPESLRAAWLKE